jgi:hypothetical protein
MEHCHQKDRKAIQATWQHLFQMHQCVTGQAVCHWGRQTSRILLALTGIDDVTIWSMDDAKVVGRWTGHTNWVFGIAVNPHNPLEFVSYSWDASVIVHALIFCVICIAGTSMPST